MLATPFWPSSSSAHAHVPARPSPLSPRSANACPRPQLWGSRAMSTKSRSSGSQGENAMPYAKREIKANPVARKIKQSPDEARERRRGLFMKKVQDGRDDKRFEGRSEMILRSDYLSQQRKWEAERVREAPMLSFEDFEETEEVPFITFEPATPRLDPQVENMEEVDEVEQMEEEELRQLVMLQQQQKQDAMQDIPSSPTRYGSDEEDYDDIFTEYLGSQQKERPREEDAEMMDMN